MHSPRVRTALQSAADPLVVDLGYGALPVTTLELASRLRTVRTDVRVIGLEIDPDRVERREPPSSDAVEFGLGGFELAGQRPVLVRAFNVLRQYPEDAVDEAWALMRARLAPGGLIVDGTCDELGRRCGWVLLDGDGPVSLTLACDPFAIEQPVRSRRAAAESADPPQCPGSADQHAAGRRRPRLGQRRGPRRVRPAGAVARDAEHAARQRLSRSNRPAAACATASSRCRGQPSPRARP